VAEFVSLTCPKCGASLKITSAIDRFACAHCGAEHIVRRTEGVVSLAPVLEGLVRVQAGVDKAASELAIPRLKEEIAALKLQHSRINLLSPTGIQTQAFLIIVASVGLAISICASDSSRWIGLGISLPILLLAVIWALRSQQSKRSGLDARIREKEDELLRHQAAVAR
jgi:ribosomal protein S27AE